MGSLIEKLHKISQHRYASLVTGGFAFILVLLPTLASYFGGGSLTSGAWIYALLLASILGALVFTGTDYWQRTSQKLTSLEDSLENTVKQLEAATHRQKISLQISQMFVEAQNVDEVIELVLRLCKELLNAEAASFVPLDEHAQPLSSTSLGKMPFPAPEAWLEYLASPVVRQKCSSCQNMEELTLVCPLLKGSFLDTMGVYCLPVRRAEQEYGILNLYLPRTEQLDGDSQALLRTLMDETTRAMEAIRLRERALSTIRQIQAGRANTDMKEMLEALLASLHETLDADYALVATWFEDQEQNSNTITWGKLPENALPLLEGIIRSVAAAEEPVIFGNGPGNAETSAGLRAVMAVPLLVEGVAPIGVMLVANQRNKGFNQRQLLILQTIAGQAALVLQNANLITQIEFNAIVQERTRLAREIHDGLAQTLGYLKLKTAQMLGYLERSETELAHDTIRSIYRVLDDAYQDTRQSIDGLRIAASSERLPELLQQAAVEFEELSGVRAVLCDSNWNFDFPPEVNAQLIRIVQEALSNVRKHAHAKQVEISCREIPGYLILDVTDDGTGFLAEDVPGPYRHGLRGMQERAELIGADYQITSRLEMGTTVSIRMPINKKETNYETDTPGRSR